MGLAVVRAIGSERRRAGPVGAEKDKQQRVTIFNDQIAFTPPVPGVKSHTSQKSQKLPACSQIISGSEWLYLARGVKSKTSQKSQKLPAERLSAHGVKSHTSQKSQKLPACSQIISGSEWLYLARDVKSQTSQTSQKLPACSQIISGSEWFYLPFWGLK